MAGLHRDQAQFDRANWLLKFLIPLWMVQVSLCMILVGIFSYRLSTTLSSYDAGNMPLDVVTWEAINISLASLCLLFTVHEILRVASERLTPLTMLVSHVTKLACALVCLILDSIVYTNSTQDWSTAGIVIDSLLM